MLSETFSLLRNLSSTFLGRWSLHHQGWELRYWTGSASNGFLSKNCQNVEKSRFYLDFSSSKFFKSRICSSSETFRAWDVTSSSFCNFIRRQTRMNSTLSATFWRWFPASWFAISLSRDSILDIKIFFSISNSCSKNRQSRSFDRAFRYNYNCGLFFWCCNFENYKSSLKKKFQRMKEKN